MIAWLGIWEVMWAPLNFCSNIELTDRAKIHFKLFLP